MASNLRACKAGISPSKAVSNHSHLSLAAAHTALPTSMSKPCNSPVALLDSNGGYWASRPNLSVEPSASAENEATAQPNNSAIFNFFISLLPEGIKKDLRRGKGGVRLHTMCHRLWQSSGG